MTDADGADVIVVGAGPTGLMLATELCRAGVVPVVLERHPRVRDVARAGGLNGMILEVLRLRGSLDRFESESPAPRPTPRFPWGGIHVDFTRLPDPPMEAVVLPQPRLEALLEAHARELGADVRRSHEVVALVQHDEWVHLVVAGPEGTSEVRARYVVGCDGGRSRVREMAGVAFPGTAFAETERMGTMTRPASLTVTADGDLDVPGFGTIPFGYTATEHGVFAFAQHAPDVLGFYTSEEDPTEVDDDVPMTLEEMGESIRRVLGVELPLGEPHRLTRFTYQARQAETYRAGRVLLAGDAAHLFPAGGVAINAGMLDAVNLGWKLAAAVHGRAPDDLLDSYHHERHADGARTLLHTQAQVALRRGHDAQADALRQLLQELLDDEPAVRRLGALMTGDDLRCPVPGPDDHPLVGTFVPELDLGTEEGSTTLAALLRDAGPVLVDLGRGDHLGTAAAPWADRVELVRAATAERPADAVLVRPDLRVAWAAATGEPPATVVPSLRAALARWFGPPADGRP